MTYLTTITADADRDAAALNLLREAATMTAASTYLDVQARGADDDGEPDEAEHLRAAASLLREHAGYRRLGAEAVLLGVLDTD